MTKTRCVGDLVEKVRSKNAGPFWLTIDLFCGSPEQYQHIVEKLHTKALANLLQIDAATIKRFDIESLHVVKFSLPRPTIQGAIKDRDLHGASWAALVAGLPV